MRGGASSADRAASATSSKRRMNMRILTSLVSAAALTGATSVAFAATMTGDITALNMNRHTLTLDNGSTVFVANSGRLEALRLGEKVTVAYSAANGGGQKQAKKITPDNLSADLGG
jgi:Protein of unknown function (DUF1344)